jgi:uncharacterized protein YecE (DUF72 family)
MEMWIPPIKSLLARKIPVYVYFNNHYAGYAPVSVELFGEMFNADRLQFPHKPPCTRPSGSAIYSRGRRSH